MDVEFSQVEGWAEEAQVEIRLGYEGRGRSTEGQLAIIFDSLPYLLEFVAIAVSEDPDVREWIGAVRTDQMGREQVAYWPNTTVIGAPEDEEMDEDEDDEEDED